MVKKFNPFDKKLHLLKAKGGRRKKLCRHMVDIWNETVRYKLYPESKLSLTIKREERLIWFLEEVLGHKISWETYCQLVSKLGFLGKITLNWALIPDNAYRALINTPHGKERYQDMPWGNFYDAIKKECQKSLYGPQWFQISQNLAKRLGQVVYHVWFSQASMTGFTENTVTIQVETTFRRDYILTYFFLDLAYAIQAAYPSINQINIQTYPPKSWKRG